MAAIVGLAPTAPPPGTQTPIWWRPWIGWLHLTAATLLFVTYAYFSICLFTRSDLKKEEQGRSKRARNKVYVSLGVVMLTSLALIVPLSETAVAEVHLKLVLESIASTAFGASWLIKACYHDR